MSSVYSVAVILVWLGVANGQIGLGQDLSRKFMCNLFQLDFDKMTCAQSEDLDQPGHSPRLIRVFAVRSKGCQRSKASSSGQRILWSHWADAQADPSLSLDAHVMFWFCHACAQLFQNLCSAAMHHLHVKV